MSPKRHQCDHNLTGSRFSQRHKIKTNNFVNNSRISFNAKLPQFSSFLCYTIKSIILLHFYINSLFSDIYLIFVNLYLSPIKLSGLFGYEGQGHLSLCVLDGFNYHCPVTIEAGGRQTYLLAALNFKLS